MATTIKLRNSVVKDKVPAAGDIQIGEVCVGAHSESPALFFKDNADNIIKIEPGAGAESSPTPPSDPSNGDLWFDSDNNTLNYYDGTAWVELGEAGDSPVKSVNTKTGVVVLDAGDVGALASGDDVSELNNDAGYITLNEVPASTVTSVNNKKGAVVLDAEDVGALAPGDGVSELNNDAGYITVSEVPASAVTSVNTKTGAVVLAAGDVGALAAGDNVSELTNDAGYITVSESAVTSIIAGNQIDVETNGSEVTINSTAETLVYSGVVDLTGQHTQRITPPLKQDLFLNTGEGTISASWAAEITNASAGDPCFPGDFVVYNQTNYELISAGGPPATDALWVESGNKLFPANLQSRVGIGFNDPLRNLHLKNSTTFLRVEATNTGSGQDVAALEIKTNLSRSGGVKSLDESDNELWFIGRHYNGGSAATRLDFDVAGSTAMSIPANGNVGVGVTDPQAKLAVDGAAFIGKGGEDSEILRLNTDRSWSFFQRGSGAQTSLDLASGDNKNFTISTKKTGDADVSASVFINGADGNIGIGTDNPQAKLDVNGTIEADDLTINGSSFRNIPQNSQTSAYTLLVSDIGKVVCITTGGVTIPSGVFSSGDAVTIYNDSGSDQTITQGSSVTLRTAGTSTDGDKTLAGYGLCTALCVASNVFVVAGAGLS